MSKFTLPLWNIKCPSFELCVGIKNESEAEARPALPLHLLSQTIQEDRFHDKTSEKKDVREHDGWSELWTWFNCQTQNAH